MIRFQQSNSAPNERGRAIWVALIGSGVIAVGLVQRLFFRGTLLAPLMVGGVVASIGTAVALNQYLADRSVGFSRRDYVWIRVDPVGLADHVAADVSAYERFRFAEETIGYLVWPESGPAVVWPQSRHKLRPRIELALAEISIATVRHRDGRVGEVEFSTGPNRVALRAGGKIPKSWPGAERGGGPG